MTLSRRIRSFWGSFRGARGPGAAAAARRVASQRPWLGEDAAAARAGRSGVLVVALDLHSTKALRRAKRRGRQADCADPGSSGRRRRERAGPGGRGKVGDAVEINPTHQEGRGTCRSTETTSTRPTIRAQVAPYFAAATQAAIVRRVRRRIAGARRGQRVVGLVRLAVNMFSGLPAEPPSGDFIMRNAMDAQEVAIGAWPGDERNDSAAFYATPTRRPEGSLTPAQPGDAAGTISWRVPARLGRVRTAPDPRSAALDFARSAFATLPVCDWEQPSLTAPRANRRRSPERSSARVPVPRCCFR